MRQVETSSLHHGVAGARHTFVPLPPAANKLDLLLQVGRAVGRCGALPCAWRAQRAGGCLAATVCRYLPPQPALGTLPRLPLPQVCEGEHARGKRIMIFCNTLASCRAGEEGGREAGRLLGSRDASLGSRDVSLGSRDASLPACIHTALAWFR